MSVQLKISQQSIIQSGKLCEAPLRLAHLDFPISASGAPRAWAVIDHGISAGVTLNLPVPKPSTSLIGRSRSGSQSDQEHGSMAECVYGCPFTKAKVAMDDMSISTNAPILNNVVSRQPSCNWTVGLGSDFAALVCRHS